MRVRVTFNFIWWSTAVTVVNEDDDIANEEDNSDVDELLVEEEV